MKIVITEEQKHKLFVPRKIDERKSQFENEIKKYLISIKDNIVWDYFGSIENSYDYESDYSDPTYYDFNGRWLEPLSVKNIIHKEHGIEEGDKIYSDLEANLKKITDHMYDLLDYHGDSDKDVVYVSNTIKKYGDGSMEFDQTKEIKVSDTVLSIKI